jgi:hypothetical protein
MRHCAFFLFLVAGCARGSVVPAEFRGLPGDPVVEIRISATKPTLRIVQVADFHFVPLGLFAGELGIDDEREVSAKYEAFLDELQTFEVRQAKLLRSLVSRLGVRQIFAEGLTPDNFTDFQFFEDLLRDPAEGLRDPERRMVLLQYGPAFWLAAAGVVAVTPLDEMETLMASKPIKKNGTPAPDPEALERRHDAQLRRLLDGENVNRLVVLGANHDLTPAIRRAGLVDVEYVVIVARSIEKTNR